VLTYLVWGEGCFSSSPFPSCPAAESASVGATPVVAQACAVAAVAEALEWASWEAEVL